jgi:hypothetical protein
VTFDLTLLKEWFMPEDNRELREINFRRLLPWTELFRAFRIALDLRKLTMAAVGLLITIAAWQIVSVPFGTEGDDGTPENAVALPDFGSHWPLGRATDAMNPVGSIVDKDATETGLGRAWFGHKTLVLEPFFYLSRPFQQLFASKPEWSLSNFVHALICGLLAVLIWAFFGGAITRLAAVQVARDEKIGLRESLRFTCGKYFSFVGGPLFPFAGILIFLLLCLGGGLFVRIPWLGDLFAGVLWVLPLLAGFVMTIILVGVAVGWPLMFATVSAEGSDSFDALSRSYSYVYQRPWHYAFYWSVALVYGAIVTGFVVAFATLLVYLSGWAVSWGAGQDNVAALFAYAPEHSDWRALFGPAPDELTSTLYRDIGARLVGVWLYVLYGLMAGFVFSYFWSASTIIYFLLRRSVDATDLDEVYLEEEEQEEFGMSADFEHESGSPAVQSPTDQQTETPHDPQRGDAPGAGEREPSTDDGSDDPESSRRE